MVKKLIAIGDSFLAGAELKITYNTWPGLFAKQHNLTYQCLAKSGHSGEFVLRTLFDILHTETEPCFIVIHWPNALRFEYANSATDTFIQVSPGMILNGNEYSAQVQKMYYQHVKSFLGDKWNTLRTIYTAIQALNTSSHCYAMTTVDDFLFDTDYANPDYLEFLQQQCSNNQFVFDFDGMTFTQWSDHNNFQCGPYGHPLESAHQQAFEYFEPTYKKIIATHTLHK